MNYFEKREREILKNKYDTFYAHSGKPVRGITVNPLKADINMILKAGISAEPSPFCKNSLVLTSDTFKPGLHPYHHAGGYYVQEPSAAAPAALLNVQKGDVVLDMCAAPGGKSAQLAAALGGEGLLVANEYVPQRAAVLKSNLQRMGFTNCVITNADTSAIADGYAGFFNKILADVPCSGEGMFYKEPQAVAQHSEKLVLSCARLGGEILENAAKALSDGGTLLYSTCTFSPQENEMQIGLFLQKHPEFELLKINVSFGSEGEKARSCGYDYTCEYTRRIYPCHCGEGHFMALLRKKGEAVLVPVRAKQIKECAALNQFFMQYFPKLAGAEYHTVKDSMFISPPIMLAEKKRVNIILQGVCAGSLVKGRFEPDHALYMAYGPLCENKEELILSDDRVHAFLRGEEIEAVTAVNGYCSVLCDGLPLGHGKVSGGKVKNHYPKGLRNLK